MASIAKRQRFGGTKVRSGCITCKARHLKCDETRPFCQRCTKGGRPCGGYLTAPQGPKYRHGPLVIINYRPPPSGGPRDAPDLEFQEQRSLCFFQSRTALELPGSLPTELWSRTILQIARHEPAIRHAIVALGSLHEHFELRHDPHAAKSEFAMQQYCKALQKVVSLDLVGSEEAEDVALISCVLFAAFESLQGHYKSALTHITSGVQILSEQEASSTRGIRQGKYLSREVLMLLFVRMNTQSMEIGDEAFRPTPHQRPNSSLFPVPEFFASVEEAHISFDIFFNHTLHFLQSADRTFAADSSIEEVQAIDEEHSMLVEYFQLWSAAFENSCFPQTEPAVLILKIYRILMNILAGIELILGELSWDQYIPDFSIMMDLVEGFLHCSSIQAERGTASSMTPRGPPTSKSSELTSQAAPTLSSTSPTSIPESRTTPFFSKRPKPRKVSHGFMGIQPEATPLVDPVSLSVLDRLRRMDTKSTAATTEGDTASPKSISTAVSSSSGSSPPSAPAPYSHTTPPGHSTATKRKPTFTLTLGIITPLWMTCSRCRDPYLRRRALQLLLSCNRKEGIWDSILTGRVAERVISIEEAGALPLSTESDDIVDDVGVKMTSSPKIEQGSGNTNNNVVIVTDARQIPEHARIRELEVSFRSERQGTLRFCKSIGNASSVPEQFVEIFSW